jgi:hypothetical protein
MFASDSDKRLYQFEIQMALHDELGQGRNALQKHPSVCF